MGKEWYINGWGRDNMEYWAPARAGGQCSILYTTLLSFPLPLSLPGLVGTNLLPVQPPTTLQSEGLKSLE